MPDTLAWLAENVDWERWMPYIQIGGLGYNLVMIWVNRDTLWIAAIYAIAALFLLVVIVKFRYHYQIRGYLAATFNRPTGRRRRVSDSVSLGEKRIIYNQWPSDDPAPREGVTKTRVANGPLWLRKQQGYLRMQAVEMEPSAHTYTEYRGNQVFIYDSATTGPLRCLKCGWFVPPVPADADGGRACKHCYTAYQTRTIDQIIIQK